ncbi:MAG TPA: pyrroline-5-carboxylate reductase [Pseudomonadales bacterium]|nr:pyrroline-5-carboxylate reductase [Pseudomonadales bacterium]
MTNPPIGLQTRVGFIGAGNMATSLIGGLIAKGFDARHLFASDPNSDALQALARRTGITACPDNNAVITQADVLVLAVKPQVMKTVLADMATTVQTRQPLIISIAAGISIENICAWLGAEMAVVRCMPNTPALVQLGASGLYANSKVNAQQREQAQTILAAVGIALWLDNEEQIDAVTAVSGSGPAYFFLLMEAMIVAGEKLGLATDVSRALTLQTALGAAQMAITSDVDVAELRKRVTSPGGTTERAIAHFETSGLREIVNGALQAAALRSQEMNRS